MPTTPSKKPPGDLTGTLTPAGILSMYQAYQDQQAQELAAKTQAATQQATQAQQDYQGAAQAPLPGRGDEFLPSLLGNLASVISENPAYQQQAQERLQESRSEMLKRRADNLQTMKDIWNQKAEVAAKAGDTETELKARTQLDKLEKTHMAVQDEANRAEKIQQERMGNIQSGKNALIEKGVNPGGLPFGKAGDLLPYVDKSGAKLFGGMGTGELPGFVVTMDGPDGEPVRIVDVSDLTGNEKDAAAGFAAANNLPTMDKDSKKVLNDVQGARDNVVSVLNDILPLLPNTPEERLALYAPTSIGAAGQWLKTQAAYRSWRTAAIKTLRATAGSGGLRINQQEIKLAVENDIPKITDTREVALQKMTNIRIMLDNSIRPYLSRDWRASQRDNFINPKTLLPKEGNLEMIDPDGKHFMVPIKEFRSRITMGWARVVKPLPPLQSPQGLGGGTSGISITTQHPVYPPGAPEPPQVNSKIDAVLIKHGLATPSPAR